MINEPSLSIIATYLKKYNTKYLQSADGSRNLWLNQPCFIGNHKTYRSCRQVSTNCLQLSTENTDTKNAETPVKSRLPHQRKKARDVAERPVDVRFATTEAERRPRMFESGRARTIRKRISVSRYPFSYSWERETGLEPATPTLARLYSTNWATRALSFHIPSKPHIENLSIRYNLRLLPLPNSLLVKPSTY